MNQIIQTTVDVDKFLATLRRPRGRLIFALDATMSRQPTWDTACHLQAEMFRAAGALDVQLVYYRGDVECRASRWIANTQQLAEIMRKIDCRAGHTPAVRRRSSAGHGDSLTTSSSGASSRARSARNSGSLRTRSSSHRRSRPRDSGGSSNFPSSRVTGGV